MSLSSARDNSLAPCETLIRHSPLLWISPCNCARLSLRFENTEMAWSLAARNLRVGLLDLDICGPSIPHLLGLRKARVGQSEEKKLQPVRVAQAGTHLDVMSIGFLLDSEAEPVVLRGPRKDGVVRQFLSGVSWGSLDVLLIDTPPGTSDEHLSLISALSSTLSPEDGALVVSTPQAVSLVDVRKELSFCEKQSLRVLGVVENMAPLRMPLSQLRFYQGGEIGASVQAAEDDMTEHALSVLRTKAPELLADNLTVGVDVFPAAEGGAEALSTYFGVPFLGRVPLDRSITRASELGEHCSDSAALQTVAARLLMSTGLDDGGAADGGAGVKRKLQGEVQGGVQGGVRSLQGVAHCGLGGPVRTMRTQSNRRPMRGFPPAGCRGVSHSAAAPARQDEVAHEHERQAPGVAVARSVAHTLFPTTVHVATLSPSQQSVAAFNDELVGRALAGYERCWRSRPFSELSASTGLPGTWRTTANMLYFRQQLSYWREKGGGAHIGALQRSAAFRELVGAMRTVATDYLRAHRVPDAASLVEESPLFCWASVHTGGSTHPPHVHSDAVVTGTYYARRPEGAAPLLLEDPRGRSPFDLIAGLEHRLRYGGSDSNDGARGAAIAPFDQTVSINPKAGSCVVFPPWLVHSVPIGPAMRSAAGGRRSGGPPLDSPATTYDAADDELLRVSFSFNLLGRWEHTVCTQVE